MLIDKMNELKQTTSQEEAVIEYINDNLKAVLNMNCNELAKASYTSSSTIIRLCKKLGFKGYLEFKVAYTSEYAQMMEEKEIEEVPFKENTSIDEVIDIVPKLYIKTINYAKTMLDRNTLIRITNLMKQADRIEIYGVGINYNLANMIAYRFETINKDCFVYTSAHWEHLKYLETSKLRTIAILISRTGKNPIILDAAKRLKESHAKTISISGNSSDLLKKETDQNIQILDYENELELKTTMFYIGAQYVMDVCISSIQIYDIKEIEMISKKNGR